MAAKDYDVLIIGSGASGGMAAYTLTQKGIKCLMLDAGPLVDDALPTGVRQGKDADGQTVFFFTGDWPLRHFVERHPSVQLSLISPAH